MSSVRSASPASLYWDSPPRESVAGAPNPARGRTYAQQGGGAAGTKSGGNGGTYHGGGGDDDDDDDDDGGFVDRSTVESFMSNRAAGPRGIPPLAQEMEAVISDSGSAFDDGVVVVVDSAAGLRRRRGENGSSGPGAGRPGKAR